MQDKSLPLFFIIKYCTFISEARISAPNISSKVTIHKLGSKHIHTFPPSARLFIVTGKIRLVHQLGKIGHSWTPRLKMQKFKMVTI